MSLPCQSRTSIVQHVLTLTLCRHYSAPPNPRNLSPSAGVERPSVATRESPVQIRVPGALPAREDGRDKLPAWLLELRASSSKPIQLQPVPQSLSSNPKSPIRIHRKRWRRKQQPPSDQIAAHTLPDPNSTRPSMQLSLPSSSLQPIRIGPPWSNYLEPEPLEGARSVFFEPPILETVATYHIPQTLAFPQSPLCPSNAETLLANPPPFHPGPPAARLKDQFGSRIVHETARLEMSVNEMLQQSSPLRLERESLQQLSQDYIQVLGLLNPSKGTGVEPGFWSKRNPYFHRSVRQITMAHLKVLQRIKDRDSLRPSKSLVQSFTPLLISLVTRPRLQQSSIWPNHWAGVDLAEIVETMLQLGFNLTPFQLSLIIRHTAAHRTIRSPESRKNRMRRSPTYLVEAILRVWTLRKRLFHMLDQSPLSKLEIHAFRAQITMSTINDTSTIGLETVIAYPILKARLAEARVYVEANLERWVDLSERTTFPEDGSIPVPHEPKKSWNARMALLRAILQHYLLSHKLRARSAQSPSSAGVSPNPEQILSRMIRALQPCGPESSAPARSTIYLYSAIYSLRNQYMKEGHFYKLLHLVWYLGSPATQCPPLTGQVMASLISATRKPAHFPTLIILMNRLPLPTTPVRFTRLWPRNLMRMAVLADRDGIAFPSASEVDARAKVIWAKSGWEGLWKSTLLRWGYGYTVTQHAAMLHAQDEGHVDFIEMQVQSRTNGIRKKFKSSAYDEEAATFPMMQLPPSAATNIEGLNRSDD